MSRTAAGRTVRQPTDGTTIMMRSILIAAVAGVLTSVLASYFLTAPTRQGRTATPASPDNAVSSCIMAILATLSVTPHLQAAEMQLPDIRTQPTPQAVLDEHIDALNKCDWNRLVAQYPEDAQIHLLNGTIITGRKAIGELFAGFCKDPKDGGLNGINFKVVQSTLIGGTFATHWVASAPFLAEPYKGSDAYITKDGLMQAMVTTFDGAALKMKK